MIQKSSLLFRKITAAFLLLVILFITAVKVLHTHSSEITTVAKAKATTHAEFTNCGKALFACDVCEYQLAKDAAADFSLPVVESKNSPLLLNTFFIAATHCAAIVFFERRGPPVFTGV